MGLADAHPLRLFRRTVGSEDHVDPRREVRIVAGVAKRGMVSAVELGRAQHPLERPQRQPHVGVDEHGPRAPDDEEARPRAHVDAEDDGRDVDEHLRLQAVEGVLAPRREPVQLARGVVDRVEPPQRLPGVLGTVAGVGEQIAEDHDHDELYESRHAGERAPQRTKRADRCDRAVQGVQDGGQDGEPQQDLGQEEHEVGGEALAQDPLRTRRREALERPVRHGHPAEVPGDGRGGDHRGGALPTLPSTFLAFAPAPASCLPPERRFFDVDPGSDFAGACGSAVITMPQPGSTSISGSSGRAATTAHASMRANQRRTTG
jgi:hypothetical protein